MRRIVFILALLTAACSPGTRKGLQMEPNQLLRQSSDLYRSEPGPPIKSVGAVFLNARNVRIRYPDGRFEIIPRKEIWGYSNKKGKIFRLYGKTEYEVVTVGDVITYEQQSTQNVMAGNHPTVTTVIETFYSKTLDSKIFSSRKKALNDLASL
ncbi:hypothetical protein [Larkinella terrae]|uniref:Lipoprotein n=1 Tax=Larkinella terrae TaxID=2025311 RepID=A0A7K0EGD6_9BACT|nr:hypothetical protein [Larkinella terrae]MRS60631.1 hypothetical protein [Larkinella terrae]